MEWLFWDNYVNACVDGSHTLKILAHLKRIGHPKKWKSMLIYAAENAMIKLLAYLSFENILPQYLCGFNSLYDTKCIAFPHYLHERSCILSFCAHNSKPKPNFVQTFFGFYDPDIFGDKIHTLLSWKNIHPSFSAQYIRNFYCVHKNIQNAACVCVCVLNAIYVT